MDEFFLQLSFYSMTLGWGTTATFTSMLSTEVWVRVAPATHAHRKERSWFPSTMNRRCFSWRKAFCVGALSVHSSAVLTSSKVSEEFYSEFISRFFASVHRRLMLNDALVQRSFCLARVRALLTSLWRTASLGLWLKRPYISPAPAISPSFIVFIRLNKTRTWPLYNHVRSMTLIVVPLQKVNGCGLTGLQWPFPAATPVTGILANQTTPIRTNTAVCWPTTSTGPHASRCSSTTSGSISTATSSQPMKFRDTFAKVCLPSKMKKHWTLYNYFIFVESSLCEEMTCQNGGSCVYVGGDIEVECQCVDPFVGDQCQFEGNKSSFTSFQIATTCIFSSILRTKFFISVKIIIIMPSAIL